MPVMVRPKKSKATKIAYKILGKPANVEHDKNAIKKDKFINVVNRPYYYGWAR